MTVIAGWLIVSFAHYRQARFDIIKEYRITQRGIDFGRAMNAFAPKPTIGVNAAGGVALTYQGNLRDLLGLNWVAMAHANPNKTGFRNHASFEPRIFWQHPPDVVALFTKPCPIEGRNWVLSQNRAGALKGLYVLPRFQQLYLPVLVRSHQQCWPTFAARAWLRNVNKSQALKLLSWDQFAYR